MLDDRQRPKSIAVDFDGVIAEYNGWRGPNTLGACRTDVCTVLGVLKSEGWKIIIHTTRAPEDILDYLDENNIPYDEINCNSHYANKGSKPVATIYWDDRALPYSGDAFKDIELIRNFRTWNDRM